MKRLYLGVIIMCLLCSCAQHAQVNSNKPVNFDTGSNNMIICVEQYINEAQLKEKGKEVIGKAFSVDKFTITDITMVKIPYNSFTFNKPYNSCHNCMYISFKVHNN
jgi:hypothetical protein